MKKTIIVALATCFLSAVACHKENSNKNTGTGDLPASQYFSLDNSAGAVIVTGRGTKIHFPANAFADGNNALINGKVDIEVKEIFTPMEMILSGITSTSVDGPLESGGEFYIGATANSKKVTLAAGKKIQIDLPDLGVKMDSMRVFNLYTWGPDSTYASRQTWVQNKGTANVVMPITLNAYQMFCDSTNWINCDKFLEGKRVPYNVMAGNTPSLADTRVYIHFTGRNSVMEIYRYIGSDAFFGQVIEAPVTIVGICIKDGEIYSSVAKADLKSGQSSGMNFSKTTESDLKATLSALK